MNENHIMYKLFKAFELNNVLYLHFKSNTNLCDSFKGKGDFDVLVDKNEIRKVETLIIENNGKRHNPTRVGNYSGVDNWLVFDEISGVIYHLHLHYQLVTGKQFVKDYVIPWNNLLFETRIKDPEFGIYVTNPNVELLLLAFRNVLKAKFLDYFKKVIGNYRLDNSTRREWDDMYRKSSESKIKEFLINICPKDADDFSRILMKSNLSSSDFLFLHRTVRQVMKPYRRYGAFEAMFRTFLFQLDYRFTKYWNRKMDGQFIAKKISLQGGLIIAFVGVDGAGKSTVSNEISKWIGKKIECKRIYMGAGEESGMNLITAIKTFLKSRPKNSKKKKPLKNADLTTKPLAPKINLFQHPCSFLSILLKMHMINRVQKKNYNRIKQIYRYKHNGGISVLDRWPQIEKENINDGPKVVGYSDRLVDSWFTRRSLRLEKKYLGIVKTIKPDIIFKLNISLDACMNRKEEHTSREYFENKIKELKELNFQNAKIIEINAEQPYEEEILLIKKVLWKFI